MAHLDNTDHYRVYDGDEYRALRVSQHDTAVEYAIECNAEKITAYSVELDSETDFSWAASLYWLKEQPEVPAILPDFIKQHLPPEAIEAKRKQQLGRV